MKFADDALSRQVVPRWRFFEASLRMGELEHHTTGKRPLVPEESISKLKDDWALGPSLAVASDLVSSAITLNIGNSVSAAEYILSSDAATLAARMVATAYLTDFGGDIRSKEKYPRDVTPDRLISLTHADCSTQFYLDIRHSKERLKLYPRNPILWCNLARCYTSLGQIDKAMNGMRVALALAPENRFVLRSASRMYLHLGERGLAHSLLAGAANIKADPWLLSGEIATADANGKTSKNMKHAHKMLELGKLKPFHLSELASAIGTVEIGSGKHKNGKRLIHDSLREPAENSIAQAAWLDRREGGFNPIPRNETTSSEANAWKGRATSNWDLALEGFRAWQADEPFSSRPAIFGATVAGTALQDYALAARISEYAIPSNPDDPALYNNWAWALALDNQVEKAVEVMKRASCLNLNDAAKIVFPATRGLIAFRQDNLILGRLFYMDAVEEGRKQGDVLRESYARVNHAMEELRAGTSDAENYRREGIEASKNLTDPIYAPLIKRLVDYGRDIKAH